MTHPLQDLYDQVPDSNCQGLCVNICSRIDLSVVERQLIERRYGVRIPHGAEQHYGPCPALDQQSGRCLVYEDRPMVCRLYGSVEDFLCEHGCRPDPAPLSNSAGRRLSQEALLRGGIPPAPGFNREERRRAARSKRR